MATRFGINPSQPIQGFNTALLALLWLFFTSASHAKDCNPWIAKIISIEGYSQVSRAGEQTWHNISNEVMFCPGDRVRVNENSRATFWLNNDTILRVDENTTLAFPDRFSHEQDLWLKLIEGAAHFVSRIRGQFNIVTPYVNAAIKGTEFTIRIQNSDEEKYTQISLVEGRVVTENKYGKNTIEENQTLRLYDNKPAQVIRNVSPIDAVQWTLYYPTIVPSQFWLEQFQNTAQQTLLKQAIEQSKRLEFAAALQTLAKSTQSFNQPQFYQFRASLYLQGGQVEKAKADLKIAKTKDPKNSATYALEAMIAIVQNQAAQAELLIQHALTLDYQAETLVAQSYWQQSQFNIEQALETLIKAKQKYPDNSVVLQRLSELHLATGNLDQALEEARSLIALQGHAGNALAFAQLAQLNIVEAEYSFRSHIFANPSDPLARLGLGLALIRQGHLSQGRQQIEYAVLLSPNTALLRSYLGKAYLSEKRSEEAATQFQLAKQLDPNDPTPWFYNALRQQLDNNPILAHQELKQSIAKNANRAVYRSRLLLDKDEAVRGAVLGQLYKDLNFLPSAINQSRRALAKDHTNATAHRILADAYGLIPRTEIGRLSELLQAQLWQPLNKNVIPPQLLETDLGALTEGLFSASLNEYDALFSAPGSGVKFNSVGAEHNISGNDLILYTMNENSLLSLGQFHYKNNGFYENNDYDTDIYNLFGQYRLSHKTSVQMEYRQEEVDAGDRGLKFEALRNNNYREQEKSRLYRIGANHAFNRKHKLIASLMNERFELASEEDTTLAFPPFEPLPPELLAIGIVPGVPFSATRKIDTNKNTWSIEIQHVQLLEKGQLIYGLGRGKEDRNDESIFTPIGPSGSRDVDQAADNGYLYWLSSFGEELNWTLGISYEHIEEAEDSQSQWNPKLGLQWYYHENSYIKLAAFSIMQRPLVKDSTIDLTHISGFDQFQALNDSADGQLKEAGIGFSHTFQGDLILDGQFSRRFIEIPVRDAATGEQTWYDNNEWVGVININKPIAEHWSFSTGYQNLRANYDPSTAFADTAYKIRSEIAPIQINYLPENNFSVNGTINYVAQKVSFRDSNSTGASEQSDSDYFWVFDLDLKLHPKFIPGQVLFGCKNLFQTNFQYLDIDRKHSNLYPGGLVYLGISLTLE